MKNTSTRRDEHVVDIRYQSGEKMHKYSAPYDLPKRVKPGEAVKLLVDLLAPSKTGTYTTTFELVGDHGAICNLPLTLHVQ